VNPHRMAAEASRLGHFVRVSVSSNTANPCYGFNLTAGCIWSEDADLLPCDRGVIDESHAGAVTSFYRSGNGSTL
jgi:hypothetical protein